VAGRQPKRGATRLYYTIAAPAWGAAAPPAYHLDQLYDDAELVAGDAASGDDPWNVSVTAAAAAKPKVVPRRVDIAGRHNKRRMDQLQQKADALLALTAPHTGPVDPLTADDAAIGRAVAVPSPPASRGSAVPSPPASRGSAGRPVPVRRGTAAPTTEPTDGRSDGSLRSSPDILSGTIPGPHLGTSPAGGDSNGCSAMERSGTASQPATPPSDAGGASDASLSGGSVEYDDEDEYEDEEDDDEEDDEEDEEAEEEAEENEDEAEEAAEEAAADHRGRLERFYVAHNADKLGDVAAMLGKYAGREEVLFAALVEKYGAEPPAPPPPPPPARARLVRFYQFYNSDKLAAVDDTLAKYDGREEELFAALVDKYGPEPASAKAKARKTRGTRLAQQMPPSPARARLVRFYRAYNSDKLAIVDDTLAKYDGREEELFAALVDKYGPEPPARKTRGTKRGPRLAQQTSSSPARARLVRFYQFYNSDKLAAVDDTLAKYDGREEELFAALAGKYGPEPPAPSAKLRKTRSTKMGALERGRLAQLTPQQLQRAMDERGLSAESASQPAGSALTTLSEAPAMRTPRAYVPRDRFTSLPNTSLSAPVDGREFGQFQTAAERQQRRSVALPRLPAAIAVPDAGAAQTARASQRVDGLPLIGSLKPMPQPPAVPPRITAAKNHRRLGWSVPFDPYAVPFLIDDNPTSPPPQPTASPRGQLVSPQEVAVQRAPINAGPSPNNADRARTLPVKQDLYYADSGGAAAAPPSARASL
jgi:hypothetical protein